MTDLRLNEVPSVRTGMLIRRPVAAVFEAFVDPGVTSNFWFTKGSDHLSPGTEVRWEWEMYDVSVPVTVRAVEPGRRILIEWPGAHAPTTVEWRFTALDASRTFVEITSAGFAGSGDEVVKEALDATEGFALLLAGAKAFLEHELRLNLVGDRFPAGIGGT